MHAYYERDDIRKCYHFYSYDTYMGAIYDDGIHCIRDYRGVTTQKQMTRFFKEFCGIKTANVYKKARAFYRECQQGYKLDTMYIFSDEFCKVYASDKTVLTQYFK